MALDAMDVNPYAFAIGIVYLAAAFPLSYGLFVTSVQCRYTKY